MPLFSDFTKTEGNELPAMRYGFATDHGTKQELWELENGNWQHVILAHDGEEERATTIEKENAEAIVNSWKGQVGM